MGGRPTFLQFVFDLFEQELAMVTAFATDFFTAFGQPADGMRI
jgi:hypothetical protein